MKFFVYGTLQSGFENHRRFVPVAALESPPVNAKLIGNYKLIHFRQGFPGLLRSSSTDDDRKIGSSSSSSMAIEGEVLDVAKGYENQLLKNLDRLEQFFGPGFI